MLSYTHGERDALIVEVTFQRVDNTSLYLLHLFHCQLVFHHDLQGREFRNDGVHVLHTCSHTTQVLRHAVTHGQPLNLKFLRCKRLVVLGITIVLRTVGWKNGFATIHLLAHISP